MRQDNRATKRNERLAAWQPRREAEDTLHQRMVASSNNRAAAEGMPDQEYPGDA